MLLLTSRKFSLMTSRGNSCSMVTNNDDPRIVRADSMRASERGKKEGGETGRRLAAASEQSAPPPGDRRKRAPQTAMAATTASLLAPCNRRARKKPGVGSPAELSLSEEGTG